MGRNGIFILITAVLSTALVVGGGTYFWQKGVFLQKKEVIPQSLPITPRLTPTEQHTGWQEYKNEEYGFSLSLPETWEGYKATTHNYKNVRDICFSFERGLPICIFQIYIHTKVEWEEIEKLPSYKQPSYINENDEFVFSYDYSPDCVQHDEFQCERSKEVPTIIKTFKFAD